MAVFSVYARTNVSPVTAPPVLVRDRYSWFAALLPPVFMLTHRLWLALLGYIVGLALLIWLAPWIGSGAAMLLYGLAALWLGFEAPELRRAKLATSGYHWRGDRVAVDADLALYDYLKQTA